MTDKLLIIKQILETDEKTDKKILSLLESIGKTAGFQDKTIHIEERESQRKPVTMSVDINTGKERVQARAEDVSLGGAFIRTEEKIAKGEDLAIRLVSRDGEEIDFASEVVRVDASGLGVLIKPANKFHQERFHKFVKKL
jgi:hypothetical protein